MSARLRTLGKAAVPSAAVAGAMAWSVAGGQGTESAPALIEQIVGVPLTVTRLLFDVFGQGEHFHHLHDWVLGPGLPAATAATVLFLAVSTLSVPAPRRPLIERLWPSRPDILDDRLEQAGLDRIDARAAGQPFVGREAEMRRLMAFAGSTPNSAPALMMLAGPGGIGKTRLSLEWLKRLRAMGWDVGQLAPTISAGDIERTHFERRRPC